VAKLARQDPPVAGEHGVRGLKWAAQKGYKISAIESNFAQPFFPELKRKANAIKETPQFLAVATGVS